MPNDFVCLRLEQILSLDKDFCIAASDLATAVNQSELLSPGFSGLLDDLVVAVADDVLLKVPLKSVRVLPGSFTQGIFLSQIAID